MLDFLKCFTVSIVFFTFLFGCHTHSQLDNRPPMAPTSAADLRQYSLHPPLLSPPVLQTCRELGLVRKKTPRGTRGGSGKHRKIPVLASCQHHASPQCKTGAVNLSNLIQVPLVAQIPDSSCDHQKLLKLFNAQSCGQKAIEIHDLVVDSCYCCCCSVPQLNTLRVTRYVHPHLYMYTA